ncbi:hypothetical protein LA66_11015 [Aureimonas altamirensis]|uniref:Uncharacterized protein n=1 Tax=Aureimonas altamirensis TaxID=370622 RepID=A0A0B1Q6Q3_9HYPH|nr:hypothetical protein [Aureimonas altamirensis]KHJ55056.1 hypothetical protein LA66_11015 [Aureimonas altamirensis]
MSITDKGLSILVFAAYHQLASGEAVRDVVLSDGSGHRADPDGVSELVNAEMIEVDEGRGRLTDRGLAALDRLIDAIRAA